MTFETILDKLKTHRVILIAAIGLVAMATVSLLLAGGGTPDRTAALEPPGGEEANDAESAETEQLSPTFSWVNAFSLDTTLDREPVPEGAVITAYDPRGNLIGRTVVKEAGHYGILAIYMNDPSTPAQQGAMPGEEITFRINGNPAVVTGPDEPIWTANGDLLELDLAALTRTPRE